MQAALTMSPVRDNLFLPPTTRPSVDKHTARGRERANKKSPLNQTCSNITIAAPRKFLNCIEDKYGISIASFMSGERNSHRSRELTLTLYEQSFELWLFPLPIIDSEIICLVIYPLINLTTQPRRDWLCSPACEMGHQWAARSIAISINKFCNKWICETYCILTSNLKEKSECFLCLQSRLYQVHKKAGPLQRNTVKVTFITASTHPSLGKHIHSWTFRWTQCL